MPDETLVVLREAVVLLLESELEMRRGLQMDEAPVTGLLERLRCDG